MKESDTLARELSVKRFDLFFERETITQNTRERECSREQHKKERFFFALFCPTKDQKFQKDERFSFFRMKNAFVPQNFSRKLYI